MRWMSRIFAGVLILLAVLGGGGWYLLQRSLPAAEATVVLAGLSAPVEILRTPEGVPHIFGEADADIYFGLGYVHAQDRFWQMEVFRRTAEGRLSELVGTPGLDADELLRRLDLYGAAEASVDDQSPYTRAALSAYAAGINARIAEAQGWGALAPEFLLFPVEVEPWAPADSVAIIKLMALQLASHVDREVLRARVGALLPAARLADILPDDPNSGLYTVTAPIVAPTQDPGREDGARLAPLLGAAFSSNAWTAGPGRTVSGAPLLANDSHFDLTAPSVWYLARLDLSAGPVIGATIPGVPSVLAGRNADLAWGLTAANMDDQDVYIERLNPEDASEVLTPDGYRPMATRTESIRVRGGAPVEITLYWTQNGPVIPGRYYHLDAITPEGHVASIARTLFDPADSSLSAAQALMQANSIDAAIETMRDFVTPAQNLMLADREGIALQVIGRMPTRDADHATQGRMPSAGWIAANRWQGMLDYALNPRIIDPPTGVIGNTNSATAERPFPFHVSFDWGDTQRILRLDEVLRATPLHSRESFMAGQYDAVSVPAKTLVPMLAEVLGPETRRRAEALDLLAGWDGAMWADRPEPLIYAAWMAALQHGLADDELGEVAAAITHPNPVFIERVLADTAGAGVWCDDQSTAAVESCAETVGAALDRALAHVAGDDRFALKDLSWGAVHRSAHDHPVLGGLPVLARVVNIHHPTSGGDNTLLRGLTRGTGETPLVNAHGAHYRGVVDMADPEASVFVISTGQSGHPLSAHYRDLAALWRDGGYIPMRLDEGAVRAGAVGVTRLLPD